MLKTRETRVEERKEEKRSEKRDRILRAAEAIFLDKGFHAASMNRKISPWLGYNSPTTGHSSLSKGLRAASGES